MVKETLKISSKTDPGKLAGAIASIIRQGKIIEMQAIGAGAVNQALKAATIARRFVGESGIDLIVIPAFENVEVAGEIRTAMILTAEPR